MNWNDWLSFASRRSAQASATAGSDSGSETEHPAAADRAASSTLGLPQATASEEPAVVPGQPPARQGIPTDDPDEEPELDLSQFIASERRRGRPRLGIQYAAEFLASNALAEGNANPNDAFINDPEARL